ncbi:transmembrane gamma-carboxyglutamic acid protein 2-like isoform X2 [Xiphophorus maculatus]|uniref:transmembrane gamma-carboxyglutamic acid protein 2-like isoform X2 n=1 Tax=Xiphophorus maculatus TaxID=8083 RepID=UPI000C6CF870|nr:transmembrane gamma-carboxyglutamic acid protein 2-like isoform X2 [Xiphophorus maculatus]XP_027878426.1 transmembrane gamma-carboxyglutamic acid protein 2-like isoform X2 [Xiphophorus couchianus]
MGHSDGQRCSPVGQAFPLMAVLHWIVLLSLLQTGQCYVRNQQAPGDPVFLDAESATSFMSRSLLANHWDFELVVKGDLQRECIDETCNYEEAREIFEDDEKTRKFWSTYDKKPDPSSSNLDVSGLVAGILAIVVTAVIATVLGVYCYKNKKKPRTRSGRTPVRMGADGAPVPEVVPLSGVVVPPPPLPSYNEALIHSGQHDAPPPPYSGPSLEVALYQGPLKETA